MIRYLSGGGGASPAYGPCVVHGAYNTVRYGCADRIEAGPGEVAVCTYAGDAESFSSWVVGPAQEVAEALLGGHRAYRNWGPAKRERMADLAAQIQAHQSPDTPIARLAGALKVEVGALTDALRLARVAVQEPAE